MLLIFCSDKTVILAFMDQKVINNEQQLEQRIVHLDKANCGKLSCSSPC